MNDGRPRDPRRILHDFNNILTILRGSSAFLEDAVASSPQAREDLAAIVTATDRAESLMRELMTLAEAGAERATP